MRGRAAPRVVAVETVLPPFALPQAVASARLTGHMRRQGCDPATIAKIAGVAEASAIECRYLASELNQLLQPRTLTQASADYQAAALELAEHACRQVSTRTCRS